MLMVWNQWCLKLLTFSVKRGNGPKLHKGHDVLKYYSELLFLNPISLKNILDEILKVINLINPEPREHIRFVIL